MPEAVKETMFFDRWYDRGIKWYQGYFSDRTSEQVCGEVAPTYFDVSEVPERISKVAPDCTIIITLRHPAERAFSLYLHHLRKGRVSRPFRKAIREKPRIIEAGRYASHIPRWQSTFGKNNVHFLFLDEIKRQPQVVFDRLCDWLGVNRRSLPSTAQKKVNAASMPRSAWLAKGAETVTSTLHALGLHRVVNLGKKLGLKRLAYAGGEDTMPELSSTDRTDLIHEYKQDVAFVERITGRTLPHWRK